MVATHSRISCSYFVCYQDVSAEDLVKELPIEDPNIPLGQGYAESKWIAEMILQAAVRETPLLPVSVRVGQISGGVNGAWNTSDWVGAIVKSSLKIGVLPQFQGVSSISFLVFLHPNVGNRSARGSH